MSKLIGEYARSVRIQGRLRPVEVARAMGLWKDPAKGARRLEGFEAGGPCTVEFYERLAAVLALDPSRVAALRVEEERRYQAWLDGPVPMELVIRRFPGFYLSRRAPAGLSREQAIEWAMGQARAEPRYQMCLRLCRRERVWIREGGASHWVEQVARGTEEFPSMRIGRRRVRFVGPA